MGLADRHGLVGGSPGRPGHQDLADTRHRGVGRDLLDHHRQEVSSDPLFLRASVALPCQVHSAPDRSSPAEGSLDLMVLLFRSPCHRIARHSPDCHIHFHSRRSRGRPDIDRTAAAAVAEAAARYIAGVLRGPGDNVAAGAVAGVLALRRTARYTP